MVDFHTHILPGIDDGSSDVRTSINMIRSMQEQGTDIICATPHFYATHSSPDSFLEHRRRAFHTLKEAMVNTKAKILCGAEVLYYPGISKMKELPDLCLEGTNILLLEMQTSKWSDYWVKEVLDIARSGEFTLMLAHIERYYTLQSERIWEDLRESGIIMQSNASFFYQTWHGRRQALSMLDKGYIDVIGTDAHNMANRKPDIMQAEKVITKRFSKELWEEISAYSHDLLSSAQKDRSA